MKIFIVEDSTVMREEIHGLFSGMAGIEVVGSARTVQEASRGIPVSRPDVVILDMQLPGGSGIDVLKTIREKKSSTKIIVFTNYPLVQYREKCLALGVDRFFDKHKEFNKLIETVKEWSEYI